VLEGNGRIEVSGGVHPNRLFGASCFSLIATSVTFAIVGAIMGRIADNHIIEVLPVQGTVKCLNQVIETYPVLAEQSEAKTAKDINTAIQMAQDALATQSKENTLPGIETANALRSAIATAPKSPVAEEARKLLGPAENHGGKIAFRWVSFLAIALVIIFGMLNLYDRAKGGYKAEHITEENI